MKAAVIESEGSTPHYADFAEPIADEGREIVSLVAAGIHPVVRSLAAGTHYGSTGSWPLIPGVDAVARAADGTLLYTGYVAAPYGTLAERMAVPASLRLPLPEGADPAQVAAGMNPGLSSWMPLTTRKDELDSRGADGAGSRGAGSRGTDAHRATPRGASPHGVSPHGVSPHGATSRGAGGLGTVLILGVTGAAGILAVQNAWALGAERVVGAGRDPERLRIAGGLGAETVTLTGDRATDATALRVALGDTNPSIVLDFVWGAPAEAAFAALARRGLAEDEGDTSFVEIGSLAGAEASVPAALLRSTRIRILGSGAGSSSVAGLLRQLPAYLDLIASGAVTVPVQAYPLSHIEDAWADAPRAGVRAVVVP